MASSSGLPNQTPDVGSDGDISKNDSGFQSFSCAADTTISSTDSAQAITSTSATSTSTTSTASANVENSSSGDTSSKAGTTSDVHNISSTSSTRSETGTPSSSAGSDTTTSAVSSTTTGSDDDKGHQSVVDNLLSFMKDKLKLTEPEDPGKVLSSLDVDGVVEHIKTGRCRNIITMAGAGISTSAGIPDFRSPSSGLYSNLQKYDLPYPEAIFELGYFRSNPQPFFTLAKELYPGSFNPTPCHYFIRLLEHKGLLLRHYTQNIDTLEHVAGISEEKLVEAHGSFRTAHCLDCMQLYSQDWVKEELFSDRVPSCSSCPGVVKPDIVFFGEGLPSRFFKRLSSDFPQCDLLIILGTSLTVQPFASLVDNVSATCPRLLINREAVGEGESMLSDLQRLMGQSRTGLQLNSARNTRDVALLGDCDEGCWTLADKLGWREELEQLISAGKGKQESTSSSTTSSNSSRSKV